MDIEQGKVSSAERVILFLTKMSRQRKPLVLFLTVWMIYVGFSYGVHTNIYNVFSHNTSMPDIQIPNLFPTVEQPPNQIDISVDGYERYQYVINNAETISKQKSKPYSFGERLRTELSIGQIKSVLQSVRSTHDFYCLSAAHVGIHKRIILVGDTMIVNPAVLGYGLDVVEVEEESIFYPNKLEKKQRKSEVELEFFTESGNPTRRIFRDMDAVCVQHCFDTMNAVQFLTKNVKEEL